MSPVAGQDRKVDKRTHRTLTFLRDAASVTHTPFEGDGEGRLMLRDEKRATMLVSAADFARLKSAGLVQVQGQTVALSRAGAAWLRRFLANRAGTDSPYRAQHAALVQSEIELDGTRRDVVRNESESPLSRLRSRRTRDGKPWLDEAAFQAGERLRRDFTLGCLAQKVTASWDAAIGTATSKAGAGGMADLSDSAIDARDRVHSAVQRVGPELAGVLMDVCCFLKGLETVERERRWPPRSAKFMLRAGLQILADHYGTIARGRERSPMRAWSA